MYNIVNNPIPKSNMWATPANIAELFAMLEQFTGAEKSLAMHVAMLTLNTCNQVVEDEILSKEIFAQ